jgi:GntR family transcriptional regulator
MGTRTTLVSRVSGQMRAQISAGLYPPGAQLPTEAALAEEFSVSRPTLRAALRELEALGLINTKHGIGTFVTERRPVKAGLERLDSISDSIRATGQEPGMVYVSRTTRHVLPEEAETMQLPSQTEVLELRRTILADGQVVAYSYDLIPWEVLPADFDPEDLQGSVFGYFRGVLGLDPKYGIAELHAVQSDHIGWAPTPPPGTLFLLLDQTHFDADNRLIMYSRTYFIEGRYNFTVFRDIKPA